MRSCDALSEELFVPFDSLPKDEQGFFWLRSE